MIYVIMKDGKKIKTAKNLTNAKQTADKENAQVFANGKCIYPKPEAVKAEQTLTDVASEPEPATTPYRLKALMNIRENPSINAVKLDTVPSSTVVEVYEIKDDWMKIKWCGSVAFVLYQNGKFAEKE